MISENNTRTNKSQVALVQNDSQARPPVRCYPCGVEMQLAQKASFRTGGTRGEWKLVFGELAELGETLLPLDMYVCPKCGRVKLFADEKTKQLILTGTPSSFLKKCVKCGRQIPIASEQCPYCKARQKG